MNKRAIGPVVATALLLVVAVGAVVGFQTWFQAYSSQLFSDVETRSEQQSSLTQIETLIGSTLYFKNGNSESLEILSISINNVDCHVSGTYASGVSSIPLSQNCTQNLGGNANDIVVITANGIFSKNLFSKKTPAPPCLQGYILVPGNSLYNTSNFCVMKYEASDNSGNATSAPFSTPEGSITWQASQAKCEALGSNYHLITENEWVTIAKNIEQIGANWNTTTVGSGYFYSGHNDNSPASLLGASDNDSDGYYGTLDSLSGCDGAFLDYNSSEDSITGKACKGQKRTHVLSNGEIIWDFSGNIWEWTNNSLNSSLRYNGGDQGWVSYHSDDGTNKTATTFPSIFAPSFPWNGNQSMGRYYDGDALTGAENTLNEAPDFCTGYCSNTTVYSRGGGYNSGFGTGIYTLALKSGPSGVYNYGGYRCAYTP